MKLSPREHSILTLIARGYSDKEVGTTLNISKRTVQTHMGAILIKLQARNRVNAVAIYKHINPQWKVV